MEHKEIKIPFFFIEERRDGKQICIAGKDQKEFYRGEHFDTWDCKEYGYRTKAAAKSAMRSYRARANRLGLAVGDLFIIQFDIIFTIEDAKRLHLI